MEKHERWEKKNKALQCFPVKPVAYPITPVRSNQLSTVQNTARLVLQPDRTARARDETWPRRWPRRLESVQQDTPQPNSSPISPFRRAIRLRPRDGGETKPYLAAAAETGGGLRSSSGATEAGVSSSPSPPPLVLLSGARFRRPPVGPSLAEPVDTAPLAPRSALDRLSVLWTDWSGDHPIRTDPAWIGLGWISLFSPFAVARS